MSQRFSRLAQAVAGLYRFEQVDPGNYILTVEAAGFTRYPRQAFDVASQTDLAVDVAMKTGDVRESL